MLLSHPKRSLSEKNGVFKNVTFKDCKNHIFHPKTSFFTENTNFFLEDHVIDRITKFNRLIIFFSTFEMIVLILVGKVMTFAFYPLFGFHQIVKDWNASESLAFEGFIL